VPASIITSIEILISCVVLLGFLDGSGLDFEGFLVRNPAQFGPVLIGRMSLVSAMVFLLAGFSLLFLIYPRHGRLGSLSSGLGVIVTLSGVVIAIGYLFDAPVLYGSTIIPVAFTTALAFIFLGVGLSASAGITSWPSNTLLESSVRARLLRPFLSLTVAIILFYGWFSVHIPSTNPALIASLMLFSSLVIVSVVVSKISRVVADRIERADEAFRRSVSETAAMVGHDLRNPLQGIMGAAQILRDELGSSANETVNKMLGILQTGVEYSNQIVTELVEFSGEVRFNFAETSLRTIAGKHSN
jgi:signal transduction histidine kinase